MTGWASQYNISGTVAVGDRLRTWCSLIGDVLETDAPYGFVLMLTGEYYVRTMSEIGTFAATGQGQMEYWVLVHGDPDRWHEFAEVLKSRFDMLKFDYSITVHESIKTD